MICLSPKSYLSTTPINVNLFRSFFLFFLWKFIKIVQIINFNHIVTIFWDPIGLLEFFISPNSKTTKTHNLKIHFHFYFPQFSWQSNKKQQKTPNPKLLFFFPQKTQNSKKPFFFP